MHVGVRRGGRRCPASAARPTSASTASDAYRRRAHPQARTIGGRPLSSSALMMKYVAQPTIAASAHSTPGQTQVGAGDQVEHEHQAQCGQPGTGQRHPPRPLPVPQPQVGHDHGRRGELDQDRRSDLHVLDRGEVAELGARHRDAAIRDGSGRRCGAAAPTGHAAPTRPNGVTTTAASPTRATTGHRPGTPVGLDETARQGAGHPERDGRDEGEQRAPSEPRRRHIRAVRAGAGCGVMGQRAHGHVTLLANEVMCQRGFHP